jgi:hypothetical protein
MDVDSISLGRDFRTELQRTLASCDVMLVLIDKDWAAAKDERGQVRLENTGDFVRMEVEAGLKRDIVVTPVLLKGARMPAVEELPAEVSALAYRNAFEISHSRWESDVREMIRRLRLGVPEKDGQVDTKAPKSPVPKAPQQTGARRRRLLIIAGSACIVLVFVGLAGRSIYTPTTVPPGTKTTTVTRETKKEATPDSSQPGQVQPETPQTIQAADQANVTALRDYVNASRTNMQNFINLLRTPRGLNLIPSNAPDQVAATQADVIINSPSFAEERALLVGVMKQAADEANVTALLDFTKSDTNMKNFIGLLKTPAGLNLIPRNAPDSVARTRAEVIINDPSFADKRAQLIAAMRKQNWIQ